MIMKKPLVEEPRQALQHYAQRLPEVRKVFLIDQLIKPSQFILDLGCGTGIYMPFLARHGKHVLGIDISLALCKLAKKRSFDVIVGDAEHLPLRRDIIDCAWISEVLEHLPSLTVLDEIERVTRRSIVITMPNPISPHYSRDPSHVLRYTITSLKRQLSCRPVWKWSIRGLGIERPGRLKMPRLIALVSMCLSWYFPLFAPTICIVGQKYTN